jgi:hypothetical protein
VPEVAEETPSVTEGAGAVTMGSGSVEADVPVQAPAEETAEA